MAKKQNISYQEIENSLEIFKTTKILPSEIGFVILKAFGKSEADIRRYKEGKGVLTSYNGLLIKGLFAYKQSNTLTLTSTLEEMKMDAQLKNSAPKIIAVSDGTTIIAYDMREKETYENPLNRMYCDFAFFYPLCGVERVVNVNENPADVKAAEKLAKLHDELRAYNDFSSKSELHDLNIFISRLLFCFFAEDTGIFEDNLFTGSIIRYTKKDGSDLADYLDAVFNVMDIRERNTETLKIISQFPYVNGGLFSKKIKIPKMGFKSRKIIIECGELDWKNINPDIFGSMIQAVVDPNERANQGLHYTSVPNIMKVINPLFLDELRGEYKKLLEAFEQNKRMRDVGEYNETKFTKANKPIYNGCEKLLYRMSKMKFFDPACGSGNFLIITYKMLRLLEMDILRLRREIMPGEIVFQESLFISLSQFYGIELFDFPHEVAMLSMWLAEHQMNKKIFETLGINTNALPLHNITQICCGNACRMNWEDVCPHNIDDEVFVFGNPPYLGSRNQDIYQKTDMKIVFSGKRKVRGFKKLDYIACWFFKGSEYISNTKAKCAFVSTNSITQGEQVSIIWNNIFRIYNIEIQFAYTSFKWENNAKNNAAVFVIIVGIANKNNETKYLYNENNKRKVSYISAKLNDSPEVQIKKIRQPISDLPEIRRGNMPNDKEYLRLSPIERKEIINKYPSASKFIRLQKGSYEFINDIERYCYWISDFDYDEAMQIPPIHDAVEKVRDYRINSKDKTLHIQAEKPYQMREFFECSDNSLVIPIVSSATRKYIPIGFVPDKTIVPNSAHVVYNADLFTFGVITSTMHMVWVRHTAGRLKTDFRYSAHLCYNTFPFPKLDRDKREKIEEAAENVLLVRADYPEKTLADLYDPKQMPSNLRNAHQILDDLVESCYPGSPFSNDEERLDCLFKVYKKMTKIKK